MAIAKQGSSVREKAVITYRYNSQGKVCEIIDQDGRSEIFRDYV
ncbi:MAG: hypothetical protein E7247_00685 [Paenibacillaceae bacterium]|nr:hypothetical protein [Paenibacillaceae bacterium]